jgi:hypothetical protein
VIELTSNETGSTGKKISVKVSDIESVAEGEGKSAIILCRSGRQLQVAESRRMVMYLANEFMYSLMDACR